MKRDAAPVRDHTVHHQYLTRFAVERGVRELFWDDSEGGPMPI